MEGSAPASMDCIINQAGEGQTLCLRGINPAVGFGGGYFFDQESLSVTARLKTGAAGFESTRSATK